HDGERGYLAAADEAIGPVGLRKPLVDGFPDLVRLAVQCHFFWNVEGYAFFAHGSHEAMAHVVREGEALGRQDDAQLLAASSDQLSGRLIRKAIVVEVHVWVLRCQLRSAMANEREVTFQQQLDPFV